MQPISDTELGREEFYSPTPPPASAVASPQSGTNPVPPLSGSAVGEQGVIPHPTEDPDRGLADPTTSQSPARTAEQGSSSRLDPVSTAPQDLPPLSELSVLQRLVERLDEDAKLREAERARLTEQAAATQAALASLTSLVLERLTPERTAPVNRDREVPPHQGSWRTDGFRRAKTDARTTWSQRTGTSEPLDDDERPRTRTDELLEKYTSGQPEVPSSELRVKPFEPQKPSLFSGDPEEDPEDFVRQCLTMLNLSGHDRLPDYWKTLIVSSFLRGDAQAWYNDLVDQDDERLTTFRGFIDGLLSVFGKIRNPEYAAAKLMSLRQGELTVQQYYIEVRRWGYRAGWNNAAVNHRFKAGLASYILSRFMSRGVEPPTLEASYHAAQIIEQKMETGRLTYQLNKAQPPQKAPRPQGRANTQPPPAMPKTLPSPSEYGQRGQAASGPTAYRRSDQRQHGQLGSRPPPKQITAGNARPAYQQQRNFRMEDASAADDSSPPENAAPAPAAPSSPAETTYEECAVDADYGDYYTTPVENQDATLARLTVDPIPEFEERSPASGWHDQEWTDDDGDDRHSLFALKLVKRQHSQLIYTPVLLPSSPRTRLRALVDSGASLNFIDPALCNSLGLPLVHTDDTPDITLGDGRVAPVRQYTILTVLPGEGFESYTGQFFVFPIGQPGLILGTPFFRSHEPQFDWHNMCIVPKTVPRPSESLRSLAPAQRHRDLTLPSRPPDKGPEAILGELPGEFSEFASVFSEELANRLPAHSEFDHEIVLTADAAPKHGPVYKTSEPQAEYLHNYIEEHMAKGWIRMLKSSWSSPVLFAAKKDGTLRMCIDYRYVNKCTVKVRYPLPRIDQIIDRLYAARYFSKIDLRNAYNLIRVREGDEPITAFRTQEGLFEYTVMPFGLCNAPATFQRLMNSVFRDMLHSCVVVYLDDILIFSSSREQHVQHIREVLRRLRKSHLFAKASKCEFFSHSVSFLGYYIDRDGISMDPEKVKSILDWPYPRNSRDILSFVGLANFYRTFIPGFAIATRILYDAARPKIAFVLTPAVADAWDNLKRILSSNTVVRHFNPRLPCVIETDASDYAIGAVLSQTEHGETRPVAFLSRKMQPAELNYPTHDKELLAIIYALNSWAHYLEGNQFTIKVLSDHQSLKYFTEKKLLSRRQAGWHDVLSRFDFVIHYSPGSQQVKADALSRRPDYQPEDTTSTSKSKELNPHNERVLLSPELFLGLMHTAPVSAVSSLRDLLVKSHSSVPAASRDALHLTNEEGCLRFQNKLFVPDEMTAIVMASCHEPPSMGHPGVKKTIANVSALYWWPTLSRDVEQFVRRCEVCQRTKPTYGKPYGLLQPLPVACRPWQHVACDFVGPLPMSRGYNFVLTAVDRFTKMAVFAACTNDITSFQFAELFVQRVCCRFGLPSTLVTDRGPQFTSKVWQCVAGLMGINHRLSTAYHPQTDGQSEIVNKVLGQYLRVYSNLEQTDWSDKLPLAEFCYNSTPHSATGLCPIEAYTSYAPRRSLDEDTPSSMLTGPDVPKAQALVRRMRALHKRLIDALNDANERYAAVYNRKRRDRRFEVGDWVWLNTKNLRTLRPSKKLDDRFAGPYQIERVINPLAYRLKIPEQSSLGRTFHVDLLKPFEGTPPATAAPSALAYGSPVPIAVDGHREVRGQAQWKVRWSVGDPSWETDATMQSYEAWPTLRDGYAPVPRARRPRAPRETPWKGYAWADERASSPPVDRSSPEKPLPRLRPRTKHI